MGMKQKERILVAVIGMGLALTACAGQEEPSVQGDAQPSVQQIQETETAIVQQTQEKTQADKTQEEEAARQTTEVESQTDTEETNVQKEDTTEKAETQQNTETERETVQVKGELTQADIAVTVRGVAIVPGENMENYIGALGEPDELTGVPSCIEEGDDKTYTYGGVLIYTFRANGTDQINLIEITGTEPLGKGIHIGDTEETVIAAYGDAYTVDGDELLYELDNKVIGLRMTDGKVSFMELFTR